MVHQEAQSRHKQSVFVTGASGCVGHYVVEALSSTYNLSILVRDESKLHKSLAHRPGVTIVKGDMVDPGAYAPLLREMDYCIHIATDWGSNKASLVNVHGTHMLFKYLDSARLKRVVYFSTASIIDSDMNPLPQAGTHGTDYIKTKYEAYMRLPESPIVDKVVTVFPTVIFGGSQDYPISHVSSALPRLNKLSWLIGHLGIDIAFHYIHAEDIAVIVKYLLEAPSVYPSYVLGNSKVTLAECLKRSSATWGKPIGWQLHLSPGTLYKILRALRVQFSSWDEFCVGLANFSFTDYTNCAKLGLGSRYSTIEEIVNDWRKIALAQAVKSSRIGVLAAAP